MPKKEPKSQQPELPRQQSPFIEIPQADSPDVRAFAATGTIGVFITNRELTDTSTTWNGLYDPKTPYSISRTRRVVMPDGRELGVSSTSDATKELIGVELFPQRFSMRYTPKDFQDAGLVIAIHNEFGAITENKFTVYPNPNDVRISLYPDGSMRELLDDGKKVRELVAQSQEYPNFRSIIESAATVIQRIQQGQRVNILATVEALNKNLDRKATPVSTINLLNLLVFEPSSTGTLQISTP